MLPILLPLLVTALSLFRGLAAPPLGVVLARISGGGALPRDEVESRGTCASESDGSELPPTYEGRALRDPGVLLMPPKPVKLRSCAAARTAL